MESDMIDTNVFLPTTSSPPKKKLKRCTSTPTIDKDSSNYDMNAARRGYAIIFNHTNFQPRKTWDGKEYKLQPRTGTEKDRDRLNKTLTGLGFVVKICDDLKKAEIKQKLIEVAADTDMTSDVDCIVVVVLTHGGPGCLEAEDSSYQEKELWEPFLSCKPLIGRPKLFFVQACRGECQDKGNRAKSSIRGDQLDGSSSSSQNTTNNFSIPTTADLLIMHSSYYGYPTFRAESGAYFIQRLCDEFDENGTTKDLFQLLTSVSKHIAYDFVSYTTEEPDWHGLKQMPCIISTLTKTLTFTQKNALQANRNASQDSTSDNDISMDRAIENN